MKNKSGFTLIELLTVIVILGLLLAVAIPNITKYIVQSRKKTLLSTINSYMSAVILDINNSKYSFIEPNTIYAVPIDCISHERAGNNPFGRWSPVSDEYWAYVLVQYNEETLSYDYGFMFKDDAGYGMKPLVLKDLNVDADKINTGLNLSKPKLGTNSFSDTTEIEEWNSSGFNVDNNTNLVVLDHNICDIFKPCISAGDKPGDEVICGSEKFYVIESDDNSVTMLTEESIKLTTNFKVQKQDSNATTSRFADANYWPSVQNPPEYIYSDKSLVYKYVEAYEKYLNDILLVNTASATLISYEQLVNLGCKAVPNTYRRNCKDSSYSDFLVRDYPWFSGSISHNNEVWTVNADGTMNYYYCRYDKRVRPIITVLKDEIQFE